MSVVNDGQVKAARERDRINAYLEELDTKVDVNEVNL
jgi:hypothetical protein